MGLFLFIVGQIGILVSIVLLVINLIRKKPKKTALIGLGICFAMFVVGLLFSSGDDVGTSEANNNKEMIDVRQPVESSKGGTTQVSESPGQKSSEDEDDTEELETEEKELQKTDFQIQCESNAKKYPADVGKVLFNNTNNDFKGMNYYFKGEILGGITLKTVVDDGKAWLVRNDKGYVMPIHKSYFEASVGDIVEVWGTLSGLKYSSADFEVDNVVGATGSMHAMMVSVNGEMQY